MADVAVQDLTAFTLKTPTYTAAASTATIPVLDTDDKLILVVKNEDDDTDTIVTLDDVNSVGPAGAATFDPNVSFTVPFGGERWFPIKDIGRFKNLTTNKIGIAFSAITGVTWGVFRLR